MKKATPKAPPPKAAVKPKPKEVPAPVGNVDTPIPPAKLDPSKLPHGYIEPPKVVTPTPNPYPHLPAGCVEHE